MSQKLAFLKCQPSGQTRVSGRGDAFLFAIYAIFAVMVVVLPVPAPAKIRWGLEKTMFTTSPYILIVVADIYVFIGTARSASEKGR